MSAAAASTSAVKLPAAVTYSQTMMTMQNENTIELREQLKREISYRRELEDTVAQLSNTVQSLVLFQQQQIRRQQVEDEEDSLAVVGMVDDDDPDMNSTVITSSAARPRHRKNRSRPNHSPHPPPPPPHAIGMPITLNPVLPVSSKVLELEEKFNEEQQE